MEFGYKLNQSVKINYVSSNYTTGLSDVVMTPYNPSGIPQTPVLLMEVVGQGGLYQGSFTPNAVGQWRIRISSVSNGDVFHKILEILNHNIDDVYNKQNNGNYIV
jgi:hypothetical protein